VERHNADQASSITGSKMDTAAAERIAQERTATKLGRLAGRAVANFRKRAREP